MGTRWLNFLQRVDFCIVFVYLETIRSILHEIVTMTKLQQWLLILALTAAVWFALITDSFPGICTHCPWKKAILYNLPVYALMCFACYSLGVIGYRVATFNDCVEASEELQKQIVEAKADLSKKGFKFE